MILDFLQETAEFTRPYGGQYPRPWMTDLQNPLDANCFIVGRNQRNGYPVDKISHDQHLDALFNRNGSSCRGLYDELCSISPTRVNIDRLSKKLQSVGAKILETNVVCFSTPMSRDLTSAQAKHGTEIFEWLLTAIKPKVVVVHGTGAAKDFRKIDVTATRVIEMPSLAPPAYNMWAKQSHELISEIAAKVAAALASLQKLPPDPVAFG